MSEIQLEVGKVYEVRHPDHIGEQDKYVTIESKTELDEDGFEFMGSDGYGYRKNGAFKPDGSQSDFDLVKEVTNSSKP